MVGKRMEGEREPEGIMSVRGQRRMDREGRMERGEKENEIEIIYTKP